MTDCAQSFVFGTYSMLLHFNVIISGQWGIAFVVQRERTLYNLFWCMFPQESLYHVLSPLDPKKYSILHPDCGASVLEEKVGNQCETDNIIWDSYAGLLRELANNSKPGSWTLLVNRYFIGQGSLRVLTCNRLSGDYCTLMQMITTRPFSFLVWGMWRMIIFYRCNFLELLINVCWSYSFKVAPIYDSGLGLQSPIY